MIRRQATRYESGQTSGRRTSEASNKTRKGENIHSEGGGPRGGKLEGARGGNGKHGIQRGVTRLSVNFRNSLFSLSPSPFLLWYTR